jgi:hypothetical protein
MNTDFDIDLSYFLSKVTQNAKLIISTYSKKKGEMKNDLSNLRPLFRKKNSINSIEWNLSGHFVMLKIPISPRWKDRVWIDRVG